MFRTEFVSKMGIDFRRFEHALEIQKNVIYKKLKSTVARGKRLHLQIQFRLLGLIRNSRNFEVKIIISASILIRFVV